VSALEHLAGLLHRLGTAVVQQDPEEGLLRGQGGRLQGSRAALGYHWQHGGRHALRALLAGQPVGVGQPVQELPRTGATQGRHKASKAFMSRESQARQEHTQIRPTRPEWWKAHPIPQSASHSGSGLQHSLALRQHSFFSIRAFPPCPLLDKGCVCCAEGIGAHDFERQSSRVRVRGCLQEERVHQESEAARRVDRPPPVPPLPWRGP